MDSQTLEMITNSIVTLMVIGAVISFFLMIVGAQMVNVQSEGQWQPMGKEGFSTALRITFDRRKGRKHSYWEVEAVKAGPILWRAWIRQIKQDGTPVGQWQVIAGFNSDPGSTQQDTLDYIGQIACNYLITTKPLEEK